MLYRLGSPATTEIPLNWAADPDQWWEVLKFVWMKAEDIWRNSISSFDPSVVFLCFHVPTRFLSFFLIPPNRPT